MENKETSKSEKDNIFSMDESDAHFKQERREAAPPSDDDELGDEFDEAAGQENQAHMANEAIIVLKFIDETRAMIFAQWTKEDFNNYIVYKDLDESHYVVKALSSVLAKYMLRFTSEFIVGMSLIISTIIVWNKAKTDKEAAEAAARAARAEARKQAKDKTVEDAIIVE